jgi:hypothetical protein
MTAAGGPVEFEWRQVVSTFVQSMGERALQC